MQAVQTSKKTVKDNFLGSLQVDVELVDGHLPIVSPPDRRQGVTAANVPDGMATTASLTIDSERPRL